MDLKKISAQYGRGLMRERYGMDWEQKRDLLKAQLESAQFNLQQAQKDAAEVEALVRSGQLPSSNLTAAKFILDKARQDVAMALDQAQKSETEARTGLIGKQSANMPTPEELRQERDVARRGGEARIRASEASAAYSRAAAGSITGARQAQAELDRARAAAAGRPPVATASMNDLLIAQKQAEKALESQLAGGTVGNFLRRATGGKDKPGLTRGTPEYQAALEKETQRILQQRTVPRAPGAPPFVGPPQEETGAGPGAAPPGAGVQYRRDPSTGQVFMEIAGQRYPVSPDLVGGGAPPPPEEDFQ